MNIYHDVHQSDPWIKFFIKFRWLFYLLAVILILIGGFLHFHRSLVVVYTLVMLLLGLIYNSKIILLMQSVLVTTARYIFVPESVPYIESFIILSLTYFVTGLVVSILVSNNINQKKINMDLTVSFSKLLDSRDKYTALHSENVARYSRMIAEELKLPKQTCETIYLGGLLHDIGKISIPEAILNKPAKLTQDEYEIVKQHPSTGYSIIKDIPSMMKTGVLDIVLYHHERFDGTGYPKGLKGENIPYLARITAVADAFDAMISRRVYRDGKEMIFVLEELKKNRGIQFDPEITDIFITCVEKMKDTFINPKEIK
ncbi:HD-GYP domain-containing protein [Metabacillus litoralis]|uniref:HD-GYP domain-containing protein n=1 Tax=Metabacillus litoralis TaxID=152268 RepID=A0A5C6VY13_9BACI|nr:HD-GYP domain-containing protein [Metabacillus litoralis]TXC89833.1 HD-GYP domain-containing protein [Metabacillus litoralis]